MISPASGRSAGSGIDAALAGLGVILADPVTTGAQLRAGTLLRILECVYPDHGSYSIVIPEAKQENAMVQAFFQWLTSNPEMSSITISENAWGQALAG